MAERIGQVPVVESSFEPSKMPAVDNVKQRDVELVGDPDGVLDRLVLVR